MGTWFSLARAGVSTLFFAQARPDNINMVVKVCETKEEFDGALDQAGDKAVLVDFYADWCGPCKMIAPKLEAMSNEFTNVVFLKVNVDDNSEVAEEHGISAMPTFFIFKNKNKVDE